MKLNERIIEHENRLSKLSDSIKHNIHIIRVPEEEERENGAENLFEEIIAPNFSNLGKETDIQIQGTQRTPIKIKNRPIPRHIAIKFAKYINKENILKTARKKKSLTYKGKHKASWTFLNRNVAIQKRVA